MGAWGYGLFQSDRDLDNVGDLGHEAGLTKLEEEAQAHTKAEGKSDAEVERIYFSLYGGCDPEAVRAHLDSGVLAHMIAKKEAKMLSIPTSSRDEQMEHWFSDPCYMYILLGACAMSLGCRLPTEYIDMLKKVYTEGGLMPDAVRQMKKALFGPNGFENGKPYDFESKDLLETANALSDDEKNTNGRGFVGMNVPYPGASSTPAWAIPLVR